MGSTEKEKKHKYEDLNKQTARLIIKNAKKGEQWEKDLSMRMQQVMAKGKVDTMESPDIQRTIGRHHDKCQKKTKRKRWLNMNGQEQRSSKVKTEASGTSTSK